jgi:DNA-binding CsgD family transcriptional regulator
MVNPLPRVTEHQSEVLHEVQALVRRLAADRALGETDLVILDVEVDGVRCLLLRVPEARAPLSPRESEIARMVAKGYPNKTIASVLDISSWTVASHLRRVFSKLGVSSRAAMVARLLEDGLMADLGEVAHATQAKEHGQASLKYAADQGAAWHLRSSR